MNIVLDTNIFVKACKGSYYANRLLVACLQGKYTPLFGVALLAEYEDVLRRDEIFTDTNLSLSERNDLLDDILSVS